MAERRLGVSRMRMSVLVWLVIASAWIPAASRAQMPSAPGAGPLSLAQAVALASGSAPAVEIASLRTQEARARVGQARAAFLPSLEGSASDASRTFNTRALGIPFPSGPGGPSIPDLVGPVEVFDARLRASQTVWDASSWARLGASRRGLEASREDRRSSVENAAQAAAQAYVRAARAQAIARARESDLTLARALEGIAAAQVKSGVSPRIDQTRARTEVASARGAWLVAQNQVDRAAIDLARTLGLDPSARFALADTLGAELGRSQAPSDSAAALKIALERRPELAAERARRRKASSDRLAIQTERLPRVDVAADYGLSGEHANDAIATHQLAVALTLPLLDGLRREARVSEQSAILHESEVRERDMRQQVTAEVQAAWLDLGSATELQRVASERLSLAEEEVSQARERFERGVAGNIEVINAQASLARARDADIEARFATATARIALARATGTTQTLR